MPATSPARLVPAFLVAGYGALILLQVLAHESLLVGAALLAAGALLAVGPRRSSGPATGEPSAAAASGGQRAFTMGLGVVYAGGVLAYNGVTGSGLGTPELALLAYGLLLIAAAPRLDRRVGALRVGAAVAWSLPLVAAPLSLFALDAALDRVRGGSPLDLFIAHGLVAPTALVLRTLGLDALTTGQTIQIATPRGSLALGIGLVCAGLHPGVLFLGILGLHAWQERTPILRLALLLTLGLLGVYVANLLRLIVLALVGHRWGGSALQTTHEHAGWILFVAWMILYWWLVLLRFQRRATPPPHPPA